MSEVKRETIELGLARQSVSPITAIHDIAEIQIPTLPTQNISFDVYGDFSKDKEGSYLRLFESEIAQRCGKEDALFVPSGVMAQNIALKVYEELRQVTSHNLIYADSTPLDMYTTYSSKATFMAHYSSHLFLHEEMGWKHLLQMEAIVVPPLPTVNGPERLSPLSFNEIQDSLTTNSQNPVAILLECPHRELGGKCTPWTDLRKISELCRSKKIGFHMDGARLWEAEASYCRPDNHDLGGNGDETLVDLCNLFDSVYVSFYKGLGGLTGAMLLGEKAFISSARKWLRRFGGNVYTQLPYAVSSWYGFRNNNQRDFIDRRNRLREVIAAVSLHLASGIISFDPPVPISSLVHVHIAAPEHFALKARDEVLAAHSISCFMRLRPFLLTSNDGKHCYFELNMGPYNMAIPKEAWILGWTEFEKALVSNYD